MYFLIHKQGMRYILHNEISLVAHTQQGIKNAYLVKGLFVTYRNENVNLCYFWERTYKKDDTIWD